MNRYTEKVDGIWSVSCKYEEPPYPVVTQEVIDRLVTIEDILGDKYDVEMAAHMREVGRPQDASREYIRQQWRLIREVNDSAERRV